MRIVNPAGRTPSNSDVNAYGCVCNVTVGDKVSVSGSVPCNVCAYSCDTNVPGNLAANESLSRSRMTHT